MALLRHRRALYLWTGITAVLFGALWLLVPGTEHPDDAAALSKAVHHRIERVARRAMSLVGSYRARQIEADVDRPAVADSPPEHTVVADAVLAASNVRRRFSAYFSRKGVAIVPDENAGAWTVTLATSYIGRSDGVLQTVDEADPVVEDGQIRYQRGNGVTEWFENRPDGFEQGWTVAEPPAGSGDVVVQVQIAGLSPKVVNGDPIRRLAPSAKETFVQFRDASGTPHLNYHGLRAWDAEGQPLPVRFEVADARMQIHVDDSEAVYPIVIDPVIDTLADWEYVGAVASVFAGGGGNEDFLQGVATGDFNGDGFVDVAVSSSSADVFVFYGDGCAAECFSTTPDVVLNVSGTPRVVAAGNLGGPVNGTTGLACDELVVADVDTTANGMVYAYEGCPGGLAQLNTSAFQSWSGTGGEELGHSLLLADVTGDGLDDIIASGPRHTNGESSEGRLVAVYGNATLTAMNSAFDWSYEPNLGNMFLGIGDIEPIDWNFDGAPDIAVGGYNNNNGYLAVIQGTGTASGLTTTLMWSRTGPAVADLYGREDLAVGDFNNDGVPDLAVSARDGDGFAGLVDIYYHDCAPAPCVPDTTEDLRIFGSSFVSDSSQARFGWVMVAGDFDGDGNVDLAASAPYDSNGEVREGIGYIIWNDGTALDLTPANIQRVEQVNQAEARQWIGGILAVDVNADGAMDLLAGMPRYDSGVMPDVGGAELYLGTPAQSVAVSVNGLGDVGDQASLILQVPSGNTVQQKTADADGTYVFAGKPAGSTYEVIASYTGSNGKTCVATSNASGTISAGGVTDVGARCGYTVSVAMDSPSNFGDTATIQLISPIGGSVIDSIVVGANGNHTFGVLVDNGSSYEINIADGVAGERCVQKNARGAISGADATTAAVNCGAAADVTVNYTDVAGSDSLDIQLTDDKADHTPQTTGDGGSAVFQTIVGASITIGHATLPVGDRCVFGGGAGQATATLTGNYAVSLNCGVAADVTVSMNNIVNTNNDQNVDLTLASTYTAFAPRTVNNTSGAQTFQTIVADTVRVGWTNLNGGSGAVATSCSIRNAGNPTIVDDVVPSVTLTGNHSATVTCGLPAAVNVSYVHKNGTAVQLTLSSNGLGNDYTDDIRYTGLPASGTKIINIVAGTDFVVQGVGSQCTTQGNGTLTPTVTCGNEYNIQIAAVNGLAGGEAVDLWLTSDLDDDSYRITFDQGVDPVPFTINQANGCVDPGSNPNPECYVVETANWAVTAGTVPSGKTCAVTDAAGIAGPFGGPFPALWPQVAPFPVVNCGVTRVITVNVFTEPGNTVQANIVDSAGGAGSTAGLGNSSTATFNVVDGATFTVTPSNYSDLAGYCTVKSGTNITADADKDVYLFCGRPATVRAALSGSNADVILTSSATDPQVNSNVAAGNYDLNVTVGTTYAVYATSTVAGDVCAVKNPTGTAAAGINTANVTCGTARTVNVNVSGLTSGNIDLTFSSDVSENVTFTAVGNGTQSVVVPDGASFTVTYDDSNADGGAAVCNILGGSGTVSGGNATVTIQCGTPVTVTVNVANLDNAAEAVVVQMSDDTTTHTNQSILNGNAAVFNTIAGANIVISHDVSAINADTCVFGGGSGDADNNGAPLTGNYTVNLNCGVGTTVTIDLGANLDNGTDNVTVTLTDDQTTHTPQVAQTPGNGGADAVFNTIVGAGITVGFDLSAISADRCLFANGEAAASETLTGPKAETVTCGVSANVNVNVSNAYNAPGDQQVRFQLTDVNGYTTYPVSAEVDGSTVALPSLIGATISLAWSGFAGGTAPLSSYCTIDQDGSPTRVNGVAPSTTLAGTHNATVTCGEAQTVNVSLVNSGGAGPAFTLSLVNDNGANTPGPDDWTDDLQLTGIAPGNHIFTVVKGQDYVVNGTGSVCTVQDPSGPSPIVTCGNEYTINYTIAGNLGTNVPPLQLQLASSLDSDSYTKTIAGLGAGDLSAGCVDPGNNPNPNCYVVEGATYTVSVIQTPAGQYCAVTDSTGTATGTGPWPQAIGSTVVECSSPFTIGGALAGLDLGESVTLRMVNDKSDVIATQTFSVNGQYNFSQNVVDGASYNVVLVSEPPAKNCVLENTTGTVAGADVINVNVTCRKPYTVVAPASSAIVGLVGTGLAFKEVTSGAEAAVDATNATYFFPEFILANGDPWRLAFQQQPHNPNQICVFAGAASGVINGADAAGPQISCTTTQYGVTAQVSGLTNGRQVGLSLNGGATQYFGNGAAALGSLDHLANYTIAIASQPAGHTCAIQSSGAGQVPEGGVQAVIACSADPAYQISVNVAGLQGDQVRLVETAAGLVTNVVNGGPQNATFPRLLTNGTYTIQVDRDPQTPSQTCLFGNGLPSTTVTINNGNVVEALTCATDTYSVGGVVNGLAAGNSVSLALNNTTGVDTVVRSADGQFSFGMYADQTTYNVTVSAQPTLPSQTCTVAGASSQVAGAPVSDVVVTCTTDQYYVHVNVTGFDGSNLVLQNNGGDDLGILGNGTATFATPLTGQGAYAVTVLSDGAGQTCTVASGIGTLADADVTVNVTCVDDPLHALRVNVSGLEGDQVRLLEAETMQVTNASTNGLVTFADTLTNSTYTIQVDRDPQTPSQTCLFGNGLPSTTVTINNAPVTVALVCRTDLYTVGGTLSGLRGGATISLTNNGTDTIVLNSNGAFQFPAQLSDGAAWMIEIAAQPANQYCEVAPRSGIIYAADVSSTMVNCTHLDYDLDGLSDFEELNVYNTATDSTDTDADAVTDYAEVMSAFTNPLTADTDFDGVTDYTEFYVFNGPITTDPRNPDTDGDGLSDGFELTWAGGARNGTPNSFDANDLNPSVVDTDRGGVWDGAEVLATYLATDPLNRDDDPIDSDGDGISDWDEVNGVFCNATSEQDPDTDGDGLTDAQECLGYDSNPTSADSDGDGLSDGSEVRVYATDLTSADTDNDGMIDGIEVLTWQTSPLTSDTDADGVTDYTEAFVLVGTINTNPIVADTDGDGLTDGFELTWAGGARNGTPNSFDANDLSPVTVDTDNGGEWDGSEVRRTYPSPGDPLDRNDDLVDSDGDGIIDGAERLGTFCPGGAPTNENDPDSDNDGLTDGRECFTYNSNPNAADTDGDNLTDQQEVDVYATDLTSADTDNDTLTDGDEVLVYGTDPLRTDTDGDTIRDDEEVVAGVDGYITDPRQADPDGDGLTDPEEVTTGTDGFITDPNDADSDDDGLNDGREAQLGTDPNDSDSDNDGLTDQREVELTGTDPLVADTDGDTLTDGDEVTVRSTDPLTVDTDQDGVRDDAEFLIGTSPVRSDSDGDGLSDGFETTWNNGNRNGTPNSYDVGVDTNPLDVDTDDGGIWDGVEVLGGYLNTNPLDRNDDRFDADHDGIDDWDEVNGTLTDPTDPYDPDTDNDGIPDGTEVFAFGTSPIDADSDDDRLSDHEEVMTYGTLPNVADTDGDGTIDGQEVLDEGTDPLRTDTDRDGLSDTEEITEGADGYLTDPLDADSDDDRINDGEEASRTTNPNDPDSDQDGLEDGEEVFRYDTDPDVADTDGDGIIDGDEVFIYGTDPLNADSDGDQDVDGDEVAQGTNPLESDVDSVAGGGGGCSVAPHGQDTGAWILLLIPVWWLIRRRRAVLVALTALSLLAPLGNDASAQQFSVGPHNAQQFRPVEDGGSFLLTHDSRTLKQLGFNVQLAAHYGDDLLVVRNAGEVRRAILGSVVTYELGAALGILDLLQVGLSIPYHGRVAYTSPDGSQHHTSSYMGDPQLSLKVKALDREEKPVGLGLRTWLNMPLGAEDRFLGDDGPGAGIEAILDADLRVIVLGLNIGYQYRPSFYSQGVELKGQLIASAAASVPLNDTISIFTDLNGATVTNDPFANGPGDMLELEGGIRLDTKYGASLRVGGGTGLSGGMGESPLRLFATVAFRSRHDRDRDGDGIPDNIDDCPGRPEDFDGFRDEDGCPDLDDDGDGILNVDDQCPRDPEDRDGVRDTDGCPDEDNDQDGVDDVFDQCPDAKEVLNNFQDGDGCPDRADAVISLRVVNEKGKPLSGKVLVNPGGRVWDIKDGGAEIAVENPSSFELFINVPGYKKLRREVTISNGQLLKLEVVLTGKDAG